MKKCKAILLLILIIFSAETVLAQEGNVESGWKTICNKSKECKILKTLSNKGRLISKIMIYKVGGKDIVEYQTPLGVDLRKPVFFLVDEEHRIPTALVTCKKSGCIGFAEFTGAFRNLFKDGMLLQIGVFGHSQKEYLAFSHTLMGFSKAFSEYSRNSR